MEDDNDDDNRPFNDRRSRLTGPVSSRRLYTVLDGSEIRVLLLAPSLKKTDPIVLELEVLPTTKAKQYEAVSYVWGSTRRDYTIRCNNVDVQVTESLFTALVHLRYSLSWRRLWADQLCIDQTDDQELMAQVRNMGAIYSHSSRVVVWLGQRDKAMSEAWKVLKQTCQSPSLVRSDFLGVSPRAISGGSKHGAILQDDLVDDEEKEEKIQHMRVGKYGEVSETPTKGTSLRRRSKQTMTRPLRPALNSSASSLSISSSLSSLTSSISSLTSSDSSLESLSEKLPRTPIRKTSSARHLRHKSPRLGLSSSTKSPLVSPKLKQALSIFQHLYFTRLWTFQEIVLAPAAILVSDGIEFALADLMVWYFHYVSKPMFMGSAQTIRDLRSMKGETMVYDSIGSFENVIHIRHELAKVEQSQDEIMGDDESITGSRPGIKFSTLLMLTRHLRTLKAEDRVLSLLGLHPGFAEYLGQITKTEGWLPVPELFLSAFRYCVEIEESLDVLSAAGIYAGNDRRGFEGWPSWLPDWREAYPLRPLALDNSKITPSSSQVSLQDRLPSHEQKSTFVHNVSDGMPMDCRVVEEDDGRFSLTISGSRLGIVVNKPGSWPGRYFMATTSVQANLERASIPAGRHALSTEMLTQHLTDNASDNFAHNVIESAKQSNTMCDSLHTFASARTGDWVCVLFGGSLLYILRPLEEIQELQERLMSSNMTMGDSHMEMRREPTDNDEFELAARDQLLRCRFIGECAVDAFNDGSMVSWLFNGDQNQPKMRFQLL